MTTIQFSTGPALTVPESADPDNVRQLVATITNNPLAGYLAPILSCSLDVLREAGQPPNDFTALLVAIVDACDENPGAEVGVGESFESMTANLSDEQLIAAGAEDPNSDAAHRDLEAMRVADQPAQEIVHAVPPTASNIMPCCGRTPFDVPGECMTLEPDSVTCPGRGPKEYRRSLEPAVQERMRQLDEGMADARRQEQSNVFVVGPDDLLVVSVAGDTPEGALTEMSKNLRESFPDYAGRILVLQGVEGIAVVKRS